MLAELTIQNFAIIDDLSLRLECGLTVLTGETGAGKSIIIDALQTVLGAKTSGDAVRTGAAVASVEAVFDLSADDVRERIGGMVHDLGVELEDSLVLRRDINRSGRGTARVNGRAIPSLVLAQLGAELVDIHGQSDHLSVLRRDRQREVLDSFGSLLELRADVQRAVGNLQAARRDLQALQADSREAARRLDLLRFQVGEIEAAELAEGEDDTLRVEQRLLTNAGRLTDLARSSHALLSEGAIEAVAIAARDLQDLAAIDPSLSGLADRASGAQFELEDIAQEVRRYADAVEFDPARQVAVEARLDFIERLQRKYGPDLVDVIEVGKSARADMETIENLDAILADAANRVSSAEVDAAALGEQLSEKRQVAANRLSEELSTALNGLGLKSTSFQCNVTATPADDGILLPVRGERVLYGAHGIDNVAFLVSFNPGEPLRPLDKVASGGETSRFLLALKGVLAGADRTPTLVFDEVDVGVGGRHGRAVGERLLALSETHQVLSITHLPQVAALGDHHFRVSKAERNGRTTVSITELDHDSRVAELAEMMSGTGTETARRTAEELLEAARRMPLL